MAKSAAKTSKAKGARKWSAEVTENSHALDLKKDVFTGNDPKRIAQSLKRSAQTSTHRKSDPYRSAMSMLSFYITGAARSSAARKKTLERAKDELRHEFGR